VKLARHYLKARCTNVLHRWIRLVVLIPWCFGELLAAEVSLSTARAHHRYQEQAITPIVTSVVRLAAASPNNEAVDYDVSTNIGQSRDQSSGDSSANEKESTATDARPSNGTLADRIAEEQRALDDRYTLVSHKLNYLLPVSYTTRLNRAVYEENGVPLRIGLEPIEVKFQLSLKKQLTQRRLLTDGDGLWAGITMTAWWQLYSDDISSPFRETNYQPEIFYSAPLRWRIAGGSTQAFVGLEHQSNGQVQGLSRSWNRLYAGFIYERDGDVGSIRTWYRLPEKRKEDPSEPEGDDNPDILDFVGYGELTLGRREERFDWQVRALGNPATGNGGIEIGLTFPVFSDFRGYVQYYGGYGESLIDYDQFQNRLSLGLALTYLY